MQKLHPITGAPEAWMAGRFGTLSTIPRFLCCSLEHSLGDLRRWVDPLSDEQIWRFPLGDKTSVGFHLRHIAGSVDRLLTYADQRALSEQQLDYLASEGEPGASKQDLLNHLECVFDVAAAFAQMVEPARLDEPRFIGRKRMETTLGVLLAHIAEHTQRHTGQTILLAKLVR